jgi:hypothetical protein
MEDERLMPRIEALSMLIRTDEHIKRVDDLVQHFCKEEKGEEDYSNYNSELNKAYEAYRKILYSDRGAYERIYYVINESLTKRNLTHKFESIIGMYDDVDKLLHAWQETCGLNSQREEN